VYHVKERTDYRDSVRFIRENNVPNVHFHAISADLGVASLYRKNAASDEFRKIFDLSDGIIFFGGPDMPPAAYGEQTDFRTIVENPFRHYLELSMIFHLLGGLQNPEFKAFLDDRPDFPVLGICLGMQSLSVGSGGTMVQDLWSEVYGKTTVEEAVALPRDQWHKNPYEMIDPLDSSLCPYMLHPIRLLPEGRVWKVMGMATDGHPYVASSHHQAVDTFGKGLRVIARSMDGRIVEAIEHEKFPNVLGKLWDAAPEFKIGPDDRELFGYRTVLEANPPSFEFHKKLWGWFFGGVREKHSAR
jgi:putative glutamine amidotransferase